MTALSVVWGGGSREFLRSQVEIGLRAQGAFPGNHIAATVMGLVGMGRALRHTLPEDRADQQPLVSPDTSFSLIADVRLDNREDLTGKLGVSRSSVESDSGLLMRAYQKWGESFTDHLVGDFAIVIWDRRRSKLVLVRDPSGQRPLHFASDGRCLAVASTPNGILALANVSPSLNFSHLAGFVADIPRQGSATYYASIRRVEPGHIAHLDLTSIASRPYWDFPGQRPARRRSSDYIDEFRELIDQATRSRLRGAGSDVGAHLSSGIDSGAVTTTAARLLAPGRQISAFTSAPRKDFNGLVPAGRAGDESARAGEVIARYANVKHEILRPGPASPLDIIRRDALLYSEPLGLPCNQVWWTAIHERARDLGLKVMLTGESGNLTISAGNLSVLAEYLGAAEWEAWFREITLLRRAGFRFRGLILSSFAPWLPQPIWKAMARIANGSSAHDESLQLLRPKYREEATALGRMARGARPEASEARQRWRLLQAQDPGNFRHGVLENWGLDERDVTSDRRLAEFCLSLPPEMLLSEGRTKLISRLALSDRMPRASWTWPRGYQGADWYERLSRESLSTMWKGLRGSPAVNEFIEVGEVDGLIDSWPADGFEAGAVIAKYRLTLLRVLSAAQFAHDASTVRLKEAGA